MRFLWLLLLLPTLAQAGFTIKGTLSFDGDFYTAYRAGDAPQGGSCPSGYTCAIYGDGTVCDVADASGTWTVTAASPNTDEEGGCFIYKTASTSQDIHAEFNLSATIDGEQGAFAGCGVRFVDNAGYTVYNWSPLDQEFPRVKADAGGVGETAYFGTETATLPEYLALDYDTSETSIYGGHGSDGSSWTEFADFTKTLSFPVNYGVGCWGYKSSNTTTFTVDNVADGSTLELVGGGTPPPSSGTYLFEEDFDSTTWYNRGPWANRFNTAGDPRAGCDSATSPSAEFERVTSGSFGVTLRDSAAARIKVGSGEWCGSNASVMLSEVMPSLPGKGDDMYVRYYAAFGSDFTNVSQSGKLPGWGTIDDRCGQGGASCAGGLKGWSARGKQFSGGSCPSPQVPLDNYVYHADQVSTYGETNDWAQMGCGQNNVAVHGQWYCIEQRILMNTGTNSNGALQVWVDNIEVANKAYGWDWTVAGDYPIGRFWVNTYEGGGSPANQDMHWFLDDIVISETRIGCE